MTKTYDMVVMGDINLDWNSRDTLSFPFAKLVTNGIIEWMPIDELPGGSGLNFARFAQQEGYSPFLVGKIGDDPAGRFVHEWLQQRRLEQGVTVASSVSTGKAFIARDRNGIRFLLNNAPNANRELSTADVERHASVLASCQILYVSGYCLMEPEAPRTEAVLRAMSLAREASHACIVFDVVPHQFYRIYDLDDFRKLTHQVDILISEVATMRRFTDKNYRGEEITPEMADETAEVMRRMPYRGFVLRFGPSGCDRQGVWDGQSDRVDWQETGHSTAADKRGYGDRLALQALREGFHLEPRQDSFPTSQGP